MTGGSAFSSSMVAAFPLLDRRRLLTLCSWCNACNAGRTLVGTCNVFPTHSVAQDARRRVDAPAGDVRPAVWIASLFLLCTRLSWSSEGGPLPGRRRTSSPLAAPDRGAFIGIWRGTLAWCSVYKGERATTLSQRCCRDAPSVTTAVAAKVAVLPSFNRSGGQRYAGMRGVPNS